ncbi:MAG: hypothetical protein NT014_07895 [Candidatus Omnitrophica bacterium]|nr:hypothetical protein [Candidatus Omnitrophota bacterium]
MRQIKLFSLFIFLFLSLSTTAAFAANQPPQTGTLTPVNGSSSPNQAVTFTSIYTDPNGWANLRDCYFLFFIASSDGSKCFHGRYNQDTNKLYLANDAGNSWLGGFNPGSSKSVENSYVKLDCLKSSRSGSRNTLTIKWAITFKPTFTGQKHLFMQAYDDSGANSGWWVDKGTWTIIGPNSPPQTGTVNPINGSSNPEQAVNFTSTYSDPDGWQNLQYCHLAILGPAGGTDRLWGYYDQNLNKLYIVDDNGNYAGGYAPGSNNTLSTSKGKLDCSKTTISGSGITLTIKWAVTFNSVFVGTKNVNLAAIDDSFATTNLVYKGTWAINSPNSSPQTGDVSPLNGSSKVDTQTFFTSTYSDPDGWQNLQYCHLVFLGPAGGADKFWAYYDQNLNKLYMQDDSGNWFGGYTPGLANQITTSKGFLDCAKTVISNSGNTLTVKWAVTFNSAFIGTKNVNLAAIDDSFATTGLVYKGTWVVQASDTTAPQGTIKINNDNQYTNSTAVALNLSATDAESGMGAGAQMQFSNDNTTWSTPEAYTTSKNWTLSSGDGTKTVYAKFKDAAGNWSSAVSDYIILDITLPVIVLTSPANNYLTNQNPITVNYTLDGTAKSVSRTLTEGVNTLTVTDVDAAGNSGTTSINVILDSIIPSGTIRINNDNQYINTIAAVLNLSATDSGSGVGSEAQMQFSNDNSTWSTPEAYAIIKNWTLASGDGTKTVYVKFKDVAGNWSGTQSDTIILDTTPPTIVITSPLNNYQTNQSPIAVNYTLDGTAKSISRNLVEGANTLTITDVDAAGNSGSASVNVTLDTIAPSGAIKINYDDQYTNTAVVVLSLSATDAGSGMGTGTQMQFSNDSANWSSPEAYVTSRSWTLPSGDGTNTVYIKFKDAAGNWSNAFSDTIIFDTTKPSTPVVTDDGATTASFDTLHCRWSSSDNLSGIGLYQYCITQDLISGPMIVNWISLNTATEVTKSGLSLIAGKTYYFSVRAQDIAGWYSDPGYSDGIKVVSADTTPPTGTIKINNDNPYTNSTAAVLTLSATDAESGMGSGAQMQFSNDNTNWSTPEAYATTKTWNLSVGDGTKTVYVKFKDAAGNWSGAYSDTIILDTINPVIIITSPANNYPTNQSPITVNYNLDGTAKSVSRILVEGANTVTVTDVDAAGNSGTASINVTLDTIAPTGTIKINNDNQDTNSTAVALNLSATDAGSGMGDGAQMQFSNDNITWPEAESYAINKTWELSEGFGTRTVYAKFKDAAGNWSGAVSDTIELLSVPKERIYIYLNGQRVAMEENGEKFFYHNDHLGGTNIVTSETGEQVKHLEYQPFGDTKLEEGSKVVKRKFTGKELDDSTGLYNFLARLYDPKTGRFITADPIQFNDAGIKFAGGKDLQTFLANPQNLNRYSYCLNNPLRYIDPDGLLTIIIHGTNSNSRAFKDNFIDAITKTFNEQRMVISFSWSGKNSNQDRVSASRNLANLINKYQFAEREKLNIVGYSHGGNIAFLASQGKLQHKIDNLVTLGTPIREYKPNMANISNLITAYSAFDRVQSMLGGRSSNLPFIGETGPASVGIPGYGVPIGEMDEGLMGTHSGLLDVNRWNQFIDFRISERNK